MNKYLLTIVLSFACFASSLHAQHPGAKSAISFNAVLFDYYSPSIDELIGDDFLTTGAKIAYHRNLAKGLNLEIPLKLATVQLPIEGLTGEVTNNRTLLNLDAIGQLQFFKKKNVFVPYLTAGIGGVFIEDEDFDFQVPLGGGLDIKLLEGIYLMARSEYRISFADNRNNLNHHFGLKAILDKGGSPIVPPVTVTPPDSDGDGIVDAEDDCPQVAGLAAFKGCPDTDNDGIADKNDDCPTVAGLRGFNGCPDTDNDGIPDPKDNCPNEVGPPSNNGCPVVVLDTDNDGIPDDQDACPTIAGSRQMNGCPDSDGDGIPDPEDSCPRAAGPLSNNGCPVTELNEEDKETLNFAAQNIQFETNSASIKTVSYTVLDKVLDILQRYPNFNVAINGHTDSVGNSAYNQSLSERRAKSCYDYLLGKGIGSSRMNFKGYGESQPIADNKTAAGQKVNRRVEFVLTPQ